MKQFFIFLFLIAFTACTAQHKVVSQPISSASPGIMKFSFGSHLKIGYTQVLSNSTYTPEKGFGIDIGTKIIDKTELATSDKPFYFSVKIPEGNYNVTVTLGDKNGTSDASDPCGMQADDGEQGPYKKGRNKNSYIHASHSRQHDTGR